jgi:hypothetical protein
MEDQGEMSVVSEMPDVQIDGKIAFIIIGLITVSGILDLKLEDGAKMDPEIERDAMLTKEAADKTLRTIDRNIGTK